MVVMDRETSAYVAVLATITVWSTAAAAVKLLMSDLPSYLVMFYVALFAVAGNLALVVLTGRTQRFLSYGRDDLSVFALMGLLGSYGYCMLYYNALDIAPVVVVSLVQYLWPIMTVLWTAILLKERPGRRAVTGLAMSLAGVMVIATGGDLSALSLERFTGPLMAAAAAVCYGLFSAIGKRRDDDKVCAMAWSFIFYLSFTVPTVLVLVPEGFLLPGSSTLLGLAWMGVACYAIGYSLWLYALSNGDTASMSNMTFLTPFLSLVWIRLLLNEPIPPSAVTGLIVIIAGILVTRSSRVTIPDVPSSRMPSPVPAAAMARDGD
jgi:drug/metabolite transporter (DMT)-like permease